MLDPKNLKFSQDEMHYVEQEEEYEINSALLAEIERKIRVKIEIRDSS